MNKQENINLNTLDLLPAAVILFDNEKVYFLNKKAIQVFNVPKSKLKNITDFSIYTFLDPAYHKKFRERAKLILKGSEFPEIELPFINFKDPQVRLLFQNFTVDLTLKEHTHNSLEYMKQRTVDFSFDFSFLLTFLRISIYCNLC